MDYLQALGVVLGLPQINIISDELSLFRLNLDEEIKQLEVTFQEGREAVVAAEKNRGISNHTRERWLRDLKDAVFEAEDFIDRFKAIKRREVSRKRKRHLVDIPLWPLQKRRFKAQIVDINRRLLRGRDCPEWISGESCSGLRRCSSPTGALYDSTNIVGRRKEKEDIVRALISNSDLALREIPIFGPAGIGKTTLARLVFQDAAVKGHFDHQFWIWLSDACNDVTTVLRRIAQEVSGNECEAEQWSLQKLQTRLSGILSEFKFFMVIDNLCSEDFKLWNEIRLPLLAGKKGSRVLLTTRNGNVWRRSRTPRLVALRGLEDDDCWDLLRNNAFPRGDHNHHPNLQSIGVKIAKRCHGSALLAKLIGQLLSKSRDARNWYENLIKMSVIIESRKDITSSLQVSYDPLEYDLKRCFAICCIFPCGHEFEKDEVIRLWMAEGLIPTNTLEDMLSKSDEYFDELLHRSFFENSNCYTHGNRKYRIPTPMHHLVRHISKNEFLDLDNEHNIKYNTMSVRYASIMCRNKVPPFGKIYSYRNMRTLKLFADHEGSIPLKFLPPSLCNKLIHLRMLDFSYSELEELPESIGELIQLRYLGLSNTQIERLPDSVSSLLNLQTLNLDECYKLLKLPDQLSNCSNLHHICLHLHWDSITSLLAMPHGLQNLRFLQTLSRFSVISDSNGMCNIAELENLHHLRGELCILNLEVADVPSAKKTELHKKDGVDSLMLRWTCSAVPNVEDDGRANSENVVDHLRPHKNIKCLRIEDYPGRSFPRWMSDGYLLYLENLRLSNCSICELPVLSNLRRLKNLHVEGLYKVKSMRNLSGCTSLKSLTLLDMTGLTSWSDEDSPGSQVSGNLSHHDRNLEKLEIRNCPALPDLPVFASLRDLVVLVRGSIQDGGQRMIRSIRSLTSLSSLSLTGFSVQHLTNEILQPLSYLKELKIDGFANLISFPGLQELSSLECLEVSSCPQLTRFGMEELPPRLKGLQIRSCARLECLPWGMSNLASLRDLEIQDIRELDASMVGMLPGSISYLRINGCHRLVDALKKDLQAFKRIRKIAKVEIDYKSFHDDPEYLEIAYDLRLVPLRPQHQATKPKDRTAACTGVVKFFCRNCSTA